MNKELTWLFLDMNSYFASVEQQINPALRGKPVAVVPMMVDGTCAIAASYEAKAYGIKTGTKIYEAKRLCPGLRCVLAKHDAYVDYHHKILEEMIKHVPINKVWSVDEASSKLPPRLRTREAAMAVAQKLKDGIRKNVGSEIKCSIGLAPNGFLAKVATDMQKPDGLVVLEAKDLPGRLFDLSLRDLPGINVNMEERLRKGGVRTIEDLWNTSPKQARQIWGSVAGEKFWYNLHGYDIPDQETNTSVFGHSRVLDTDMRSPAAARLVARRLTVKAATRMRRKEFFGGTFQLSARSTDGERWAAELRLSPAQDNFTFLKALDDLWSIMITEMKPQQIKKISVTIQRLCRRDQITPDMFETASIMHQEQTQRRDTLSRAMDKINEKYGAEAIKLGLTPQTKAGHVGTKIAFSRIPELAEFWE